MEEAIRETGSMTADELAAILARVEAGMTTAEDAERLRELLCDLLDMALAGGRELGYFDTYEPWERMLSEVCDIEILTASELHQIRKMELTHG